MPDVVDAATRSRMMASIKGRDTSPEVALRKALHARGFRYRLHQADLPGKPDLVLRRYRTVIFVHGCFWHRHEGCKLSAVPATRQEFWRRKFADNVARDQRNVDMLIDAGWRVTIVWECSLRKEGAESVAQRVVQWIRRRRDRLKQV